MMLTHPPLPNDSPRPQTPLTRVPPVDLYLLQCSNGHTQSRCSRYHFPGYCDFVWTHFRRLGMGSTLTAAGAGEAGGLLTSKSSATGHRRVTCHPQPSMTSVHLRVTTPLLRQALRWLTNPRPGFLLSAEVVACETGTSPAKPSLTDASASRSSLFGSTGRSFTSVALNHTTTEP